jgi:hypothetical protein
MTTPEDPGKETRILDVKGRNVVVRRLTDAQLILLGREARLASKDETDPHRRLSGIGRIFDILESAVVQEEDRDYLMDLTVSGDLELKDLMEVITAFDDSQEEKKTTKVRRGRYATKQS